MAAILTDTADSAWLSQLLYAILIENTIYENQLVMLWLLCDLLNSRDLTPS